MARLVVKTDFLNLEPVKALIEEIEKVKEMKEEGCSYKHAYRTLMNEYEVFKAHVKAKCDDGEVER